MKKSELLHALDITKPGLATRELIPQSTAFAFMTNRIVTYNDDVSISHPIEGINFKGVIQAEELHGLLSKINKEEIELTLENEMVILSAGKIQAGLTLMLENKLPLDEIDQSSDWQDLPDNFNEVLKFAISASAKDMSNPALTAVHINKDIMETADGFRFLRYNLKEGLDLGTFMLPVIGAIEVIKLKPTQIALGKSWVHFMTEEGTTISCRLMEGLFPKTSHLLQVEGTRILFPDQLSDMLDRAMVFSKRDHLIDESITITIEDRKLVMKSSTKDEKAWFKEEVNIRYNGDVIDFKITPYLLKDILEKTNHCVVGDDKLKFSESDWMYIMMLRSK